MGRGRAFDQVDPSRTSANPEGNEFVCVYIAPQEINLHPP